MAKVNRRPDGSLGYQCPECGAATRVTDSRPAPGGIIRRRRACTQGHRFSTFEIRGRRFRELSDMVSGLKPVLLRIATDLQEVSTRLSRAGVAADLIENARKKTDV